MLLKPKQCSSLTVITQTNKQTKQQQVFSKWDELHYTQADNDVSCSLVQRRTLQMMAAAYKKCLVVCCITAEAAAAFPFPRWRSTEQMITSTKTVQFCFLSFLSEVKIYIWHHHLFFYFTKGDRFWVLLCSCVRCNVKCSKHIKITCHKNDKTQLF